MATSKSTGESKDKAAPKKKVAPKATAAKKAAPRSPSPAAQEATQGSRRPLPRRRPGPS